jgi:hypothetical protein
MKSEQRKFIEKAKRTQGDYSIDDSVKLSAEDVKILIEQSKKFYVTIKANP